MRKKSPRPPQRLERPTPAGGAFSIAYCRDDGSIEIAEFAAEGEAIAGTYGAPPRPRRRPSARARRKHR
jgi:hypothetical protein